MRELLRSRWALLVLLLVVVKGAFVLSLADVFFYGEELEKGTAAKAMLDGLAVPHHKLAYHPYEGGGFVISHLVALAFLVVGENLLAHKLVALGFQVAILGLGCLLTRRLFGRHAALWFGLLFVFGPESYQKLGMIDLGIHFEAGLFLFCVLGLGGKLVFEPSQRRLDWFLLGLATGFGLYFSYQVAVAALWVLVCLVATRRKELLGSRGLLGLAGTAVGALPLVAMFALVGEAVFDIHGTALAGGEGGPSGSRLFREFLTSIFLEQSLGEVVTPSAWLVAFGLACAFLLRRPEPLHLPRDHSRKRATLFVLGYMALFAVVYLTSGFVAGRAYHFFLVLRLVPLWLFATVLVAAALGELSESLLRGPRLLARVLGAVLVVLGARASWAVVLGGRPLRLGDNWRILVDHKGYAYDQYFAKVLPRLEGTREEKLRLVEGFDDPHPGLVRADAVKNLYREELLGESGGDLRLAWERARASLGEVAAGDAERLAHYELGLGALLCVGHGWNRGAAFAAVAAAPESERPEAFEALGRFGGGGYPLPEVLEPEVLRTPGVVGAEAYLAGLGRWTYLLHRLDPEGVEEVFGVYDEATAGRLRAGFEAERAWNRLRGD